MPDPALVSIVLCELQMRSKCCAIFLHDKPVNMQPQKGLFDVFVPVTCLTERPLPLHTFKVIKQGHTWQ